MNPARRLDPLIRHAERREHSDARQLGECRAALVAIERQLQALYAYRDDYRARFAGTARAGVSTVRARSYQAFLHQLDGALEQTLAGVTQHRQKLREAEARWLAARSRRRALARATLRRAVRAQRAGERREQRRLDEHAGHRVRGTLFER